MTKTSSSRHFSSEEATDVISATKPIQMPFNTVQTDFTLVHRSMQHVFYSRSLIQILVTALILLIPSLSFCDEKYTWIQRTGGDAIGTYPEAAETNFTWSWDLGSQQMATGRYTTIRTGSGATYAGAEFMADSISAAGFLAAKFDNSPFSASVGDVDGIYQFISEGESYRAPDDASPSDSTTVSTFTFDKGFASPANTLIELFDPGAFENGVNGPFSYTFTATLNGVAVDTTKWKLDVEDPYGQYDPYEGASNGITWDGRSVNMPRYLNGATSKFNYPDTICFLNTGTSTFDTLKITAIGLNVDTFAVGIGARPTNVVLFLHGFQGSPDSWNKFTKKLSKKAHQQVNAPIIFGGNIEGAPATKVTGVYELQDGTSGSCDYFFYRLSFGAYDTASSRVNLLGQRATQPTSGDFETFDTLGLEVDQAIATIIKAQPSAHIVIVAHSRGGLAARAFLQGNYQKEKDSVIGLVTLGTPHAGSYFGRLGMYLSNHPKSEDPETWRLARILRHADQVDAYRPTVSDLATGGPAITALNATVGNLPTSSTKYCNYVYSGRAFGDFPFALGNIFHGSDSIPGHVSDAAKQFMIGNTPYGQIGGDGIVDPSSQRMDKLPGLPSKIDITTLQDPNGIFHTFEHDQNRDILNSLEVVSGWHVIP